MSEAGDEDDRQIRIDPLDSTQELKAVHKRHVNVTDDEAWCFGKHNFHRFLAIRRSDALVAGKLQEINQQIPNHLIIIDNQYSLF